MVPYLVKQSIDIKISFDDFLSMMKSDYECAYACALAATQLGLPVDPSVPLVEFHKTVKEAVADRKGEDYVQENLFELIRCYKPEGIEMPEYEEILKLGMGEG
ncbi:MAG: DUF3837 family protein [Clostridiales bacterium]|nr:DUF3837 family protein [Clostridiales bacterium]